MREAEGLLDDVADVDRRGWGAPIHNAAAVGTTVIGEQLGQQAVLPLRSDIAVVDRALHGPRAVGHRGVAEPGLGDVAKALCLP